MAYGRCSWKYQAVHAHILSYFFHFLDDKRNQCVSQKKIRTRTGNQRLVSYFLANKRVGRPGTKIYQDIFEIRNCDELFKHLIYRCKRPGEGDFQIELGVKHLSTSVCTKILRQEPIAEEIKDLSEAGQWQQNSFPSAHYSFWLQVRIRVGLFK